MYHSAIQTVFLIAYFRKRTTMEFSSNYTIEFSSDNKAKTGTVFIYLFIFSIRLEKGIKICKWSRRLIFTYKWSERALCTNVKFLKPATKKHPPAICSHVVKVMVFLDLPEQDQEPCSGRFKNKAFVSRFINLCNSNMICELYV